MTQKGTFGGAAELCGVALGYINNFSHIIKFKVHPSVKDTFRSLKPAVAMLSMQLPALAAT